MTSFNQAEQSFTVDLEPAGKRIESLTGTTLLEIIQKSGIDLVASCSGAGFCGTCRVQIIQGNTNPPTQTEKDTLEEADVQLGLRLACQTKVMGDLKVFLPPSSLIQTQTFQIEGQQDNFDLDPIVTAFDLKGPSSSRFDLRDNIRRVDDALVERNLPPLGASLKQLESMSTFLRANEGEARLAIRFEEGHTELAAVLPRGSTMLGLAIDIGSTKVALYLADLESGGILATHGLMNPQIAYGEDVVSRIAFANQNAENRRLLQTILITAIHQTAAELCAKVGCSCNQIVDVVAVGNTAMHHFFCGLPVEQLGSAPYVPAAQNALNFAAADIELHFAEGAQVYLPPIISGYVGADHVAALNATHSCASGETTLLVDIGTNTEISLIHEGQIFSCSCASGPAFEGAHIHDGMRAAPGAIEKVLIQNGHIRVYTIGGLPPTGICGSGILSAVAEMHKAGIIDSRGIIQFEHHSDFTLVPKESSGSGREITIMRKDVREIQLAKGAIRSGIDILLKHAGITAGEIQRWFIAGAFGTHIDLTAAIATGMFPDQPLERFHQVGNAAGVGAKQMLLSKRQRETAENFVDRAHYIELTTEPDFSNIYIRSLHFPKTRPELPN
jgi:uncharacterized 2Fe-2S/4Fe-4S cluster protein (DUF4445 family)